MVNTFPQSFFCIPAENESSMSGNRGAKGDVDESGVGVGIGIERVGIMKAVPDSDTDPDPDFFSRHPFSMQRSGFVSTVLYRHILFYGGVSHERNTGIACRG